MKKLPRGRHPCPDCGSQDGIAYLSDGTYCHSASHPDDIPRFKPYNIDQSLPAFNNNNNKKYEAMFDTTDLKILPIKSRGLSEDTAAKYETLTKLDPATGQPAAWLYPIYARGRNPQKLGHKIKFAKADDKGKSQYRFNPSGQQIDQRAQLFGQHLFPPGSAKTITVCEGHFDAMSAYQMFGSRYPFVSIVGGADQAQMEFRRNLEYLESFGKVYICFDRDEAGQKAAIACAQLLSPGKAHVVALDPELNDASGYLQQNRVKEFVDTWYKSPKYTPANILTSAQLKDRIRNRDLTPGIPYPFPGLNKLTYGIRKKEAVIVTAPTGVGKTTFLRETMWKILQEDEEAKIGTMFLEEDPADTGLGLMAMKASIPFHLPDAEYTQDEYDDAETILDGDRVFFFDHFGSNKIDEILSRVRYYKQGLGCDYIFIDHLSIIVSDQQQGDERKALDEIMTKLKTLTMELGIALIAVVHTNRQGQIRGTAGIEQLANIIIELDRDIKSQDADVRRTLTGIVGKNRFSGRTGPAFAARYDEDTGRLTEPAYEDDQAFTEDLTRFFDDGIISSEVGG